MSDLSKTTRIIMKNWIASHNVLPVGMREALWPLLGDRRLPLRMPRSESDILGEIVEVTQPRAIDLVALRDRIWAKRKEQFRRFPRG